MRNYIAVVITLFAAMMLALLPMPEWAVWLRPAWVLMVLLYWTLTIPSQVNVGIAWLAGMMMDLLTGTLLGEHALALIIVIYLANRFHLRINMYSMLQQSFNVFIFAMLYQVIVFGIQGFIGEQPNTSMYWLSSLTTMLLWPWFYILMRDYCHWYRISVPK